MKSFKISLAALVIAVFSTPALAVIASQTYVERKTSVSETAQTDVGNVAIYATDGSGQKIKSVPAFSAGTAYAVDDHVLYNGSIYKFTTAHPAGAWNATQVSLVIGSAAVTTKAFNGDVTAGTGPNVAAYTLATTYPAFSATDQIDGAVVFATPNLTSAAGATLSVGGQTARPIFINGSAVTANALAAGMAYSFTYDATNNRWNAKRLDTDTTYAAGTGINIAGGVISSTVVDTNTAANLNSTHTTAQAVNASESLLNGTVDLHKVSKTGDYNDLNNKPTITTYSGTAPIDVTGSVISHNNSGVTAAAYGPSANATLTSGGTFTVPEVTVDVKGHVTVGANRTMTMPTIATPNNNAIKIAYDSNSANTTAAGNFATVDQNADTTLTLHTVAKTGDYNDLSNKPTISNAKAFNGATLGGTASAYTLATTYPAFTATDQIDGAVVFATVPAGATTNNANATLSIGGQTARAIFINGSAVTANALAASMAYSFTYDATNNRWNAKQLDTDTKSTSVIGATNTASANAAGPTTNTTTFLNHVENGVAVSSNQIEGAGGVTVAATAGKLTITGTATTTKAFNGATLGGAAGAYTLATTYPAFTATDQVDGAVVFATASATANTAGATLSIGGQTARPIYDSATGNAIAPNALVSGMAYSFTYDGTNNRWYAKQLDTDTNTTYNVATAETAAGVGGADGLIPKVPFACTQISTFNAGCSLNYGRYNIVASGTFAGTGIGDIAGTNTGFFWEIIAR